MLSQALDRFGKHFGGLFLVGLVSNLIIMIPLGVLGMMAGISALLPVAASSGLSGGGPDPGAALALVGAAIGFIILMFIAMVLLSPIALMAQVAAVREVVAGNPPQLGACLNEGLRNWARGLGYAFLMYLVMGVAMAVLALLNVVIIIGTLVWIYAGMVMGVAFLYGLWAMVNEDLGVGAAFNRAWQGLFRRMGEHIAAAGVMFLIGLVLTVVGIIPILGWLLMMVLSFVSGPFFLLYAALRYETNVKPYLDPAA